MRVISQNGKLDFPYENIVVEIMDNVIVAYTPMTSPLRMAQYKSQEKAEKAMQKLHECYTGVILLQNVGFPDDAAKQLKSMKNGFICVNNQADNVRIEPLHTVFCFPQEDEI